MVSTIESTAPLTENRDDPSVTAPVVDGFGESPRVTAPAAVEPEPRIGRSAVIGGIIGFVVAVVAVTAAGAAGLGSGAAFALSLFVGVWGGIGFGVMTGATLSLALHTDRMEALARQH